MTPEAKARQTIDRKLEQAGWVVQDMRQLDLSAGPGVAVREYPTDSGPADYLLFIDRQAAGVIEAKRDSAGENLTVTERQTARYATANLKWRQDDRPLRFLFEATGQIIRFTDNADPGRARARSSISSDPRPWPPGWPSQTPCAGGWPNGCRHSSATTCATARSAP